MAAQLQSAHSISSLPLQNPAGYGARQLTPVASAESTPGDASYAGPGPDSSALCLPLQARQLRAIKASSYRPAVLRPIERPIRQSPLTPPQSSSNSLDSSVQGLDSPGSPSQQNSADGMKRLAPIPSTPLAPPELAGDDDWIGPFGLGKVTSPPTRDHWKVSSIPLLLELFRVHSLFVMTFEWEKYEASVLQRPHSPELMISFI